MRKGTRNSSDARGEEGFRGVLRCAREEGFPAILNTMQSFFVRIAGTATAFLK
jgi:hypothetical protein